MLKYLETNNKNPSIYFDYTVTTNSIEMSFLNKNFEKVCELFSEERIKAYKHKQEFDLINKFRKSGDQQSVLHLGGQSPSFSK